MKREKEKQARILAQEAEFKRTVKCSRYQSRIERLIDKLPPFPMEYVDGHTLSVEWLYRRGGFDEPFMCKTTDGLDIKLPSSSTRLSDIASIIGPTTEVNLIEVGTQQEIYGCTIGEYARYLEERDSSHKVINLISMEISATPLSAMVQSPRLVRELDWIDLLWPLDRRSVLVVQMINL